MPVYASKSDELDVRRRVESHLLTLGMTVQDVAAALDIDQGAVRNDLKKLGGRERFPSVERSTTERREQVFSAALKMFAGLRWGKQYDEEEAVNKGLSEALAKHIGYERLKGVGDGVAAVVERLTNPEDPEYLRPYRSLLRALFGTTQLRFEKGRLLDAYLLRLGAEDSPSRKVNRGNIANDISVWAITEYSDRFTARLDDAVVLAFDEAFKHLSARELKVVRLRFGIEEQEKKLEEIATIMGVTRERVRQLEARAKRRLRHYGFDQLKHFAASPDANFRTLTGLLFPSASPETDISLFLDKSVSEFELPVRTYIWLEKMGIMTVRALVQRTEEELVGPGKLRWKDVKVLKGILEPQGLSFRKGLPESSSSGMVPGDETTTT